MSITILRLGHRVFRDQRITTHVALTARAFGADKIIISGEKDEGIIETINKINNEFGGEFVIEYERNWKKVIKNSLKNEDLIVHLTMYGVELNEEIKKEIQNKNVLIIVGGSKVPGEIYQIAHYNVAIGNQPHSEVSAVAIFLNSIINKKEFDGEKKIIPSEKNRIIHHSKSIRGAK